MKCTIVEPLDFTQNHNLTCTSNHLIAFVIFATLYKAASYNNVNYVATWLSCC